jgi:hypothetical protein
MYYNATLWRVRVTIVALETKQRVLCVELCVTVIYVEMLSAAQQCFCGKFVSLTTLKRTQVFMQIDRCYTETEERSCSLADRLT